MLTRAELPSTSWSCSFPAGLAAMDRLAPATSSALTSSQMLRQAFNQLAKIRSEPPTRDWFNPFS